MKYSNNNNMNKFEQLKNFNIKNILLRISKL